jgi:hypothetical protein
LIGKTYLPDWFDQHQLAIHRTWAAALGAGLVAATSWNFPGQQPAFADEDIDHALQVVWRNTQPAA